MTRFVVDSDILANIQRAGFAPLVTALGAMPVTITDVVWDELTVGAKANGAKQATVGEADAMLRAIAGAPTVLQPESPEAGTLVDLQRPPETEGVGEHSVIAYALHHPDETAVLLDRRALHRGVEELRGRVISFHGFLDVLRSRGLPRHEADQISRWYVQRYVPVRAPLWW